MRAEPTQKELVPFYKGPYRVVFSLSAYKYTAEIYQFVNKKVSSHEISNLLQSWFWISQSLAL